MQTEVSLSAHMKERKTCLQVLKDLIFWNFHVLFPEVNKVAFAFGGDES